MPVINTFPFNILNDLYHYNETYEKSTYINLIKAEPLVPSVPPFCLCDYSTNNFFTAEDVQQKSKTNSQEVSAHDIEVLGFLTDGNTRMLKTMKNN